MNLFGVDILFVLLAALVISAILSISLRNIAYAILSLFILTLLTGIIFYAVNAPFVALVQIAVFSGAIMILFIFVLIMTRGGVSGEEEAG